MDIMSGPARVVSSGQATTFAGHPLEVSFQLDEGVFVVEWVFAEGEEPSVRAEERPMGRRFVCTGIDDRPGRGTAEPVLIGASGGGALMLHFRSSRWGASADRTVHWTVYLVPQGVLG